MVVFPSSSDLTWAIWMDPHSTYILTDSIHLRMSVTHLQTESSLMPHCVFHSLFCPTESAMPWCRSCFLDRATWVMHIFWCPPAWLSRVFLVSCSTSLLAWRRPLNVSFKKILGLDCFKVGTERVFYSCEIPKDVSLIQKKECWNTLWYVLFSILSSL